MVRRNKETSKIVKYRVGSIVWLKNSSEISYPTLLRYAKILKKGKLLENGTIYDWKAQLYSHNDKGEIFPTPVFTFGWNKNIAQVIGVR
jgi:hypothetical protein